MIVLLSCQLKKLYNFVTPMRVKDEELWSFLSTVLEKNVPVPFCAQSATHSSICMKGPNCSLRCIMCSKRLHAPQSSPLPHREGGIAPPATFTQTSAVMLSFKFPALDKKKSLHNPFPYCSVWLREKLKPSLVSIPDSFWVLCQV
ncbi:hypothetical protein RRG08_063286 [Elysia crispata]|uniref:Uncharacterized protein n=1 Tax=Elysia crispata TaxID=231223 RepID=A0AAE0XPK4_9GAST|nr:hypothetical protein RRG08_063286 [Elysia crispata]